MDRSATPSLDTLAVHAGRDDLAALGVHALPVDLSTTYPIADLGAAVESLDALTAGEATAPNPVYARLLNPTVARFEQALAALEGTEAAVAFASGMAALAACVLAARSPEKNHVVGVRPIYGSTDRLLSSGMLGVDVTWTDADGVAAAVRPDTALVLIETPVNPTLELQDVAAAAEAAGDVPLLVDSTFASPVLQRPAALGATLVMHSATKFIGGHGDVLAGVVACPEAWAKRLRAVRVFTGGVLHPLAAYLLHRGLTTLPLRVRRAQETASLLAGRLAVHPAVVRVLYPGIEGGDPRGLLGRQMAGPGPMLSFDLGTYGAAEALMRRLRLVTPAVSLGSVDTLIQHPAGLTQRVVSDATRASGGVSPGLLRMSVGLEAAEDLWADLAQALDR
ncbi:MAG TPA: PLP-dependent aspartate aminotransferase family protein [Rubricoccaceae bacterium]|nr:PLP-dependent aspartate aminotransferase family protein [Rubricoccaceae bacterium]